MNTTNSPPRSVRFGIRLRERLFSALVLLAVVAVTVVIFLNRERISELGNYGYLGVFMVSLISSATIILPIPSMLLLFAFGSVLNPMVVGVVASTGGTLGEIAAFWLGRSGRKLAVGDRIYERAERWVRRYGMAAVFVFAIVPPLPIDIAGAAAGALRLPLWKFVVPCFAGKMLLYTAMALAGAWGFNWLLQYFT